MKQAKPAMQVTTFEQDDPVARGEAQGEMWRTEIDELIALRRGRLLADVVGIDTSALSALAQRHLGVLEHDDPQSAAELHGIARAAKKQASEIVVLNHYDDLYEDVFEHGHGPKLRAATFNVGGGEPAMVPSPEGGTTMYLHGTHGGVLGQTCDLHHEVQPFVRLIRLRPKGGNHEAVYLTLTGCLGLAGMNQAGLGVVTTKLSSHVTRTGTIAPAVVRSLLRESTAKSARDTLWGTDITGGRHYMLADGKLLYGIEADGDEKVLTRNSPRTAHLHTNHYFDPKLRRHERVQPASTSFRRMELASTLFVQHRPDSPQDLLAFLSSHEGHPNGLCAHRSARSDNQTCAILVMQLGGGRVLAVPGCPRQHPTSEVELTRWSPPNPS